MTQERGATTDAGILRQQIAANIDFAWAGTHDRKFSPVNQQISEEELRISNSTYLIRERSLEGVDAQDPSYQAIVNAIKRAGDRSERRLKQLTQFWYAEDEAMRQKSGAKWEDLWPVLDVLDISTIDPAKLRRSYKRSISTEQEDSSWGISDTYSFASESKKPKKRYNSDETVEVPAHIVELFGNEVFFSEEDFKSIIKNLGIGSHVVSQVEESMVDSLTYLPVFKYRVVVPYQNWLFVSDEWFYDKKPNYRRDKNQEFKYWSNSLLPEVMVQPNRGKDFYTPDEVLGALGSADPNQPIH